MTSITILQVSYALVGTIYNLVSIFRLKSGQTPLSATNPNFGIVIMAAVAAVSLSQPYLHGVLYLVGWSFLVPFIGFGPVAAHFKAISQGRNLDLYATPMAAFLAFAINAIGVVFGCIGIILTFASLLTR